MNGAVIGVRPGSCERPDVCPLILKTGGNAVIENYVVRYARLPVVYVSAAAVPGPRYRCPSRHGFGGGGERVIRD